MSTTTGTYPESPGWKTNKPETSKAAARAVRSAAATLRDQVEQALRAAELTADEVAEALGKSVLSVRPRVTELFKQGKVEDTGERRKNASGHSAAVWRHCREAVQQEMFA